MNINSNKSQDFLHLGRHLVKARRRCRLTQKELARSCGLTQSDISKIEAGARWPTPPQLARLARQLGIALEWFLSGQNHPGFDFCDLVLELRHLGVADLDSADANIPGAFRPAEQIVACALRGDRPDPRIVEALPAVFAWNPWNDALLTAYAGASDRRAAARLGWLADVALTIHEAQRFPGGILAPAPLAKFLRRTKPRQEPDDLGRPALTDTELPPVSRRWNIRYGAPLQQFHKRAIQLLALRMEEGG